MDLNCSVRDTRVGLGGAARERGGERERKETMRRDSGRERKERERSERDRERENREQR